MRQYEALIRDRSPVEFARETSLEAATGALQSQHPLDEAAAGSQWTLEQYPGSWGAENSAALVCKDGGDREQARRHYQRSLILHKNREAEFALAGMN